MKSSTLIASVSLLAAVYAQKTGSPVLETNGTVLAVFTYHNHCDRTSIVRPDGYAGGDFVAGGATMCWEDGMYFWNKYFRKDSPLKIYGTSQIYNDLYVNVEVPNIDLSIQSATAFMQGVFKPVDLQSSVTSGPDLLAEDNSTFINGPLQGYQYVPVVTYRSSDPQSIWVGGSLLNCPSQKSAAAAYYASDDYEVMLQTTLPFFESLFEDYFDGVFERHMMVFFNAYLLYDYVQQNREAGNATLQAMPTEDFQMLRYYASHLNFNLYANTTTATSDAWASENTDTFRELGGRLLAGKIGRSIGDAIASNGREDKFNLVLGNFDLMLSFFAIANLPSRSVDFLGMPDLGSSMVFELYTDDQTLETDGELERSSIKVAFGFRNGTSSDDTLTYWPLFDEDPQDGPVSMSYDKFIQKLNDVSIQSLGQWCTLCKSELDFCEGETVTSGNNNNGNENPTVSNPESSEDSGMAPAVAGVIGAAIMLVIVGIAGAIAFFLFGVGVKRENRRSSILSSISSIGRSAPKEKLSSEIELPLSPTAAPMAGSGGFGDDEDRVYDTVSSAGTKVASPLASPREAHFKTWESRF